MEGVVVPQGFLIGAYWYPHWENRASIGIKVSPNRNSIGDIDTIYRENFSGLTLPKWAETALSLMLYKTSQSELMGKCVERMYIAKLVDYKSAYLRIISC